MTVTKKIFLHRNILTSEPKKNSPETVNTEKFDFGFGRYFKKENGNPRNKLERFLIIIY